MNPSIKLIGHQIISHNLLLVAQVCATLNFELCSCVKTSTLLIKELHHILLFIAPLTRSKIYSFTIFFTIFFTITIFCFYQLIIICYTQHLLQLHRIEISCWAMKGIENKVISIMQFMRGKRMISELFLHFTLSQGTYQISKKCGKA